MILSLSLSVRVNRSVNSLNAVEKGSDVMLTRDLLWRSIAKETHRLTQEKEKIHCTVCGREINQEEYEDYEGMCWECWDDQLTEESDSMFGDLM